MKRTAHNKYHVKLSGHELQKLKSLIRKGIAQARTITRARILLAAHERKLDKEIYQPLGIVRSTVHDIRKKYVAGGLKKALYDAPRPGKARKLTGVQEAEVIAIACTTPPDGHSRWTLELLTEAVKDNLGVIIGTTAIWKVCLRNKIKPWREKNVGDLQNYSGCQVPIF